MNARYGPNQQLGGVPLPHQDQAHFHPGGLPDLDSLISNAGQENGLLPGEKGYFCGFDTLAASGHPPSTAAENALIVGYEGGVCIYRVSDKQAEPIGKIDGLKGGVVGAKILPWTSRHDPGAAARPHIALIIHGAVLDTGDAPSSGDEYAAVSSDGPRNMPPSRRDRSNSGAPDQAEIIKNYQTTVEVYSLLTREHVKTLYKSTIAEVTYSRNGEFKIPPPVGDLTLAAKGKYLIVASGVSGEVLVFTPAVARIKGNSSLRTFRCIGKLWTSIQKRDTDEEEPSSPSAEKPPKRGLPVFSLSQRWLAVVPPPSSASFSINGTVDFAHFNPRPPGSLSATPPAQPPTTVIVESPGSGDFMGRISREMMQGTMKAAQWVGKHGAQAWNSYWNPTYPQAGMLNEQEFGMDQQAQNFPPTHAYQDGQTNPPNDGTPQVAIYDLQRMLDAEEKKTKNALTPLGTFEIPSGCGFLSFSPSGLHLMTVSLKGDEQCLWSLMRLYKARNYLSKEFSGQYVQQVWKFVRTTVATVVDVAWSTPLGNRCAILTARGTIHIHEIPSSAYQWPLFHRARRIQDLHKESSSDDSKEPLLQDNRWNSTMKSINGTATWLKSVSTRSMSAGASIRDLTMTPAATAVVGGKVVKAGFTKGLGALANSAGAIYHAGDNKLYIRNLPDGVKPQLMCFMAGRRSNNLAVIVGPTIQIFNVRQTTTAQRGRAPVTRAKVSKRGKQFRLPLISDDLFPPAIAQIIRTNYGNDGDEAPIGLTGFWSLRAPRTTYIHDLRFADNWHPQMEAETNPPYMPFHSDRRTSLFAFAEPETPPPALPKRDASQYEAENNNDALAEWQGDVLEPWLRSRHHFEDDSSWAFGEDNQPAAERLTVGDVTASSGASGGLDDSGGEEVMENEVRVVPGERGEGEQVVIMTTVFRKGRAGEEDFFEDDCEVLDWAEDRV